MASSYSPKLRFELVAPGEQAGLWGDTTNQNIGTLIEQAIAGVANIDLAAKSGDLVLEAKEGAEDQARSAVLSCFGTAAGDVNLVIPASTKLYVVRNSSSKDVYVKTASQLLGTRIKSGEANLVFCDGAIAQAGIVIAGASVTPVGSGGTGVGDPGFTAGYLKSPGGTTAFQTVSGIPAADIVGQVGIAQGGTGIPTTPTAGQILIGTSGGGYATGSITGTGGVTVSSTSGAIQIGYSGTSSGVNTVSSSTIGVAPTAGNVVITLSGSNIVNALGYTPASTTNPTFSTSVTSPTYYVGNTSNYITQSSNEIAFITGGLQANKFTSGGLGTNNVSAVGTLGAGGLLATNHNLSVRGTVAGQSAAYIDSHPSTSSGMGINMNGSSVFAIIFQYQSTSSGQIVVTSGSTAYQTTSDRRLKDNIVNLENSGDEIDALKPRQFTWKATGDIKNGFIADELQQVIPGAVSGEPNAVDADGNPVYQGIDASTPEMIALIVCELQSLRKRVAELEAK